MKTAFKFIAKQWISILLLAIVISGTVYAVKTMRPRGSMSVVEAQAMDMTTMKAPTGVFPVGADYALERTVGGSQSFPATIQAFNDEDVTARIPGLLSKLSVYPGDRVKAGQLLGKLTAEELSSQSKAGSLTATAAALEASAASAMIRQETAAVTRAKTEIKSAQSQIKSAQASVRSAQSKLSQVTNSASRADADIQEKEAELTYAESNLAREKQLFAGGAISRNEVEQAERDRETARSRLNAAKASKAEANSMIATEQNNVQVAQSNLETAQNNLSTANAMVAEAEARLAQVRQQAAAASASASASDAEANASGTIASYTELRALADGVVTERLISPGTPVMPGQVILKIKSQAELRVQAELPQSLASKVSIGSDVRIKSNGQVLNTKISSVFPFVEGMTRTFKVEAKIDNPGSGWDVGGYAEMEVFTESPTQALTIRAEAVKTASDGTNFVWLIKQGETKPDPEAEYTCTMHPQVSHKGPGQCPICKMDLVPRDARGNTFVERRPIKIGVSDKSFIEVLVGLVSGDQVTYAGDTELFPKAAVKPTEWNDKGPIELPSGTGQTGHEGHTIPQTKEPTEADQNQKTTEFKNPYTCTMHPQVVQEGPGKCPICKMDLVPLKKGEGE
jgi:multidrug efflux pump subunit AcrA (membrane-fusion protein)